MINLQAHRVCFLSFLKKISYAQSALRHSLAHLLNYTITGRNIPKNHSFELFSHYWFSSYVSLFTDTFCLNASIIKSTQSEWLVNSNRRLSFAANWDSKAMPFKAMLSRYYCSKLAMRKGILWYRANLRGCSSITWEHMGTQTILTQIACG